MKKLFSGIVLMALSATAMADSWRYENMHSDFGNDTRVASLKDDSGEYELLVMLNDPASEYPMTVAINPPKTKIVDVCDNICLAKINVDGDKTHDPLKLVDLRKSNAYGVFGESQNRFVATLSNSNILKIQLPLYHDLDILTFSQNLPLDMQKLKDIK